MFIPSGCISSEDGLMNLQHKTARMMRAFSIIFLFAGCKLCADKRKTQAKGSDPE
jgi:hypothetical protein